MFNYSAADTAQVLFEITLGKIRLARCSKSFSLPEKRLFQGTVEAFRKSMTVRGAQPVAIVLKGRSLTGRLATSYYKKSIAGDEQPMAAHSRLPTRGSPYFLVVFFCLFNGGIL